MRSAALDDAFEALPIECHRAWAEGELRAHRLNEALRVMTETEPVSLAHAAALELGVEGVVGLLDGDPLAAQRAIWDWRWWARPTQLQPSDSKWSVWLILAGRGWGKTRTGVEWVRERIQSGDARSIGLIGPSLSDVWKTLVYGDAAAPGLARIFPAWERRVEVRRQDRQVVFHGPACQEDGVTCGCPLATIFTAEEPEVRGPNMDSWLCDELAKWRYLDVCWDNIEMTTRAPGRTPPRICITTTPRPLKIIETLLDDPDVRVTFGSTFANAANLADKWLARMARKYGGSRLGAQELFGQVLGDNPESIFRQSWINATRVRPGDVPKLVRIVVAVDPSVSTSDVADLTGIAVLGIDARDHLYLLADLTGMQFERERPGLSFWSEKKPRKHTAAEWGELVCRAVEFYQADAVVVERNKGGDLATSNVLNAWKEALRLKLVSAPTVKIKEVHATKGKAVRAEPVSALFEQGRVHFVDHFPDAERELTTWNPSMHNPGRSPGRLDAIVWGAYALAGLDADPPAAPPDFKGLVQQNRQLITPAHTKMSAALPSSYYARSGGRRREV